MSRSFLIVHAESQSALALRDELAREHEVCDCAWSSLLPYETAFDAVIVDVNLTDRRIVPFLRDSLREVSAERRIFAVDRGIRVHRVQAGTLGATHFVNRPVDISAIVDIVDGSFDRRTLGDRFGRRELPHSAPGRASILVAEEALTDLFSASIDGGEPNGERLRTACEDVADAIQDIGLEPWLYSVRQHHRGTFQHCLLVTGIATGFGSFLGMSRGDVERLAMCGLIHDVGKAFVPIEVLDKPGRLDETEMAVMRTHPEAGERFLRNSPQNFDPQALDAALHHHEMLDGSGYPHGLAGGEVPDLTRIMTICDIYGALSEKRSYKAPLSKSDSMKILGGMAGQGKLENALVRALEAVVTNDSRSVVLSSTGWRRHG